MLRCMLQIPGRPFKCVPRSFPRCPLMGGFHFIQALSQSKSGPVLWHKSVCQQCIPMCQWIFNFQAFYCVSMLRSNVTFFFIYQGCTSAFNLRMKWLCDGVFWPFYNMEAVYCSYPLLFLTCSTNVIHKVLHVCRMNIEMYTVHMYHIFADYLGACCFYTSVWGQIVQGFLIFIFTFMGSR